MCSWNDLDIKIMSTKEYKRVSDGLFISMVDAVVSAANEVPEGYGAVEPLPTIGPVKRARSKRQ